LDSLRPFGQFSGHLVYLMDIWNTYFPHLSIFSQFWFVAPRRIWQPGLAVQMRKNGKVTRPPFDANLFRDPNCGLWTGKSYGTQKYLLTFAQDFCSIKVCSNIILQLHYILVNTLDRFYKTPFRSETFRINIFTLKLWTNFHQNQHRLICLSITDKNILFYGMAL
jgi:hypothetical protein